MPQSIIFEVLRGPRGVKIGPERPLGPFLERLGLMDASRSGLGSLLEHSWTSPGSKNMSLSSSWPLQEDSQDRFGRSWGTKTSQNGAREGPKSSSKGDSTSKQRHHKKCRTSHTKTTFFTVQGFPCGNKTGQKRGPNRNIDAEGAGKASSKPLGAILEALGAEKTIL